jgi:hypothetical protein
VRRALETPDHELVKALVEKTAVLIENREVRVRMGHAARASLEAHFSLAEKNRKYKTILDAAIEPQ